ncbi:MAG: site-specific DNA-methyltransferase [Planctomycetaceae bacterium]|jgi:DNA modification methylase|nr:site-specific DNA-methyltransferase [Planctomycetaceae bacterium]
MTINKLILGDNLDILRQIEDNSVDLIYLDPPFFSNRNYEIIWGDEGEIRSFKDRWAGGIEHYIAWLKERVHEMYRVLKPTGTLFLHCDWHANAYIRVEILDKIFGLNNFINEFIWKRSSNRSSISKAARKNYDTIFFYAKSKKYTYNQLFMELSAASKELYKNKDKHGFYQTVPLLVSGKRQGETGKIWKNIDPNKQGQEGMHWVTTPAKLNEYEKQGLIYFPKNGKTPRLKYYLEQSPGVPLCEVWDDIQLVQGKERIGYPTQKPEALLKRIIEMASNEGDLVLDPFVGGGTTIAVTDQLKRSWIGIDQSVQAVKVSELRLQKQQDLFSVPFTVQLYKYDYDTLRYKNAFEFESWIVQQFGGTCNIQQRSDGGLDGKMPDNTPIQVKRSDNIGRNVIDNFKSAAERNDKKLFEKKRKESKPVGYIIAFSFGKGAVEEAARLKIKENIIIKLVTVDEIVPIAKKPTITIDVSEKSRGENGLWDLELTASGQSDAGIEFYSWDCSYDLKKGFKPSLIMDKEGRHRYQFKAGLHHIAVKVVDNDGLENIEVIKLQVNGKIKKTLL